MVNKRMWEEWRAKQDAEREKTYFHCWNDWSNWGDWSDCSYLSGPYIDFQIYYYRCGQSNCQGGSGSWENAVCMDNAIMRFARAGESTAFYDVLSKCYWKEKEDCPEHCYMEEYGWNKPIYFASVTNNSKPFAHEICAEYLGVM